MTEDLKERVTELENRVAELEKMISDESGAQSDLVDRYDEYVLNTVDSIETATARRMMAAYETAGIVNKKKRKRRCKRLRRLAEEGEL